MQEDGHVLPQPHSNLGQSCWLNPASSWR